MSIPPPPPPAVPERTGRVRWLICSLLFAATALNYVDRQTIGVLEPYLAQQLHWTETDYANIVLAFQLAYAVGYIIFGKLIDRMGARLGYALAVVIWTIAHVAHAWANSLLDFVVARFAIGLGESGNFPAGLKAVAEWFPKRERGLATALFDSGSSVGAAISPFIVLWIYFRWGWRPAFMLPGILGFFWLLGWRWLYRSPEEHPRLGPAERQMLAAEKAEFESQPAPRQRWRDLLKLPQTWGTIIAKTFTDPVWFFVTDWFPIYLVAKGINLRSSLVAIWIPFVAADLGNFFSGAASGYLIKRGWSLGSARKALVVFGGVGVTLLIPTIFTTNLYLIALLFGLATFCYGSFTTIANVLPADLYHNESVASVSGISGTGAGIGTIIASELIGHVSDARQLAGTHSFDPIVIAAGLVPLIGMFLVLLLIRNTRATDQGLVRRI